MEQGMFNFQQVYLMILSYQDRVPFLYLWVHATSVSHGHRKITT
jgi:hypothetical protein